MSSPDAARNRAAWDAASDEYRERHRELIRRPEQRWGMWQLPENWIRLLREYGFEIERLVEIRAPEDAQPHRSAALPTPEWARRWPSEEIWIAEKR